MSKMEGDVQSLINAGLYSSAEYMVTKINKLE